MEKIKSYKCPSCSAPLRYSGESGKLVCSSCGNEFDPLTMEEVGDAEERLGREPGYDWEEYSPRNFDETERGAAAEYVCPSCGAKITGDASMGAAVCPYCGNAVIAPDKFEGGSRPDYVIPFEIEKDDAVSMLKENARRKLFIPRAFKDETKLKEITGMYVPFWCFDCHVEGEAEFRAVRTHMWSDSEFTYTKTDHYMLLRSGSADFANVPVDASTKADDAYMDAIEPFDCSKAVDFDTAYLSGYLADKYDVSVKDSTPRANARIKQSFSDMLRSSTAGFAAVSDRAVRIDVSDGKIRYALMPVWWLNIKYKDKMYRFAMNGQTGKTVGEYPASRGKLAAFFAAVFAVLGSAAAALWYFM